MLDTLRRLRRKRSTHSMVEVPRFSGATQVQPHKPTANDNWSRQTVPKRLPYRTGIEGHAARLHVTGVVVGGAHIPSCPALPLD